MRLFFLFMLLFAGTYLAGQESLQRVPAEMRMRPWLDRQEHIIWDHPIMMYFGETVSKYRHMNVGEFTTIGYQSLDQIIDSLREEATQESWSEDVLDLAVKHYRKNALGGRIFLYLTRYEQSKANTQWYFIILRNEEGDILFESKLEYQAPETPQGDGWWNYYEVLISKEIELPVEVYLNKNVTPHLSDFKFIIKPKIE